MRIRPWIIPSMLALVGVLLVRQGVRHDFRLSPVMPTMNCATRKLLDDGCSMFGACYKCEPICPEGPQPVLLAQSCSK